MPTTKNSMNISGYNTNGSIGVPLKFQTDKMSDHINSNEMKIRDGPQSFFNDKLMLHCKSV